MSEPEPSRGGWGQQLGSGPVGNTASGPTDSERLGLGTPGAMHVQVDVCIWGREPPPSCADGVPSSQELLPQAEAQHSFLYRN